MYRCLEIYIVRQYWWLLFQLDDLKVGTSAYFRLESQSRTWSNGFFCHFYFNKTWCCMIMYCLIYIWSSKQTKYTHKMQITVMFALNLTTLGHKYIILIIWRFVDWKNLLKKNYWTDLIQVKFSCIVSFSSSYSLYWTWKNNNVSSLKKSLVIPSITLMNMTLIYR